MAGWRQAVALAMTGEEIVALTALSRSRTEPAGRVSRAAMLLGYREKPSFVAVGRRLACIIRRSSAAETSRTAIAERCCATVRGQRIMGTQRRRPSPDQAEHPTNKPPHSTAAASVCC